MFKEPPREEEPVEEVPESPFWDRQQSSGSCTLKAPEASPGEPLFAHPPLVFSEDNPGVSKWYFIGKDLLKILAKKANITSSDTGKGHNLKQMLDLRRDEDEKSQRLLYAFNSGRRFSDVLQMDNKEFKEKS